MVSTDVHQILWYWIIENWGFGLVDILLTRNDENLEFISEKRTMSHLFARKLSRNYGKYEKNL